MIVKSNTRGVSFSYVKMASFEMLLSGWDTEDSATYQFLYTTFYEGAFYFLPIYLGYAAAKKLGASQGLGMLLGAILIAPSVTTAAANGENISVYGISIAAANYSQPVLPMMLSMPVLWQVEKFFKKVMPDTLSTIFTPLCTMLVTEPALFGVIMRWKRTMLGMFVGGAVSAVLQGILNTNYYMAGGGTNLLVFLNYLQGGMGNVVKAVVGCLVAVALGAAITFPFGFTKEELEKLSA